MYDILKKEEVGKIIEVKLEKEYGKLVYKAKTVKENKVIDFIVDAKNGRIIFGEIDNFDN
jgi:uncharacterized membrane protein YkoI